MSDLQDDIPANVTFQEYSDVVRDTDNTGQSPGVDALQFALQGLFGEVGSLVSAVKKKRRDREAYAGYGDSVQEEVGDVLWYLTHLGNLLGTRLAAAAGDALVLFEREGREPMSFHDLQPSFDPTAQPQAGSAVDRPLRQLELSLGLALREIDPAEGAPVALVRARMAEMLRHLVGFADAANVSLTRSAALNMAKASDRWPGPDPIYPPLLDAGCDREEQLPRRYSIHFAEQTVRGSTYVVQRCNGIPIGDRLTDNMHYDDGYRFHDCFHLAYAAVLGWSPVTRALFRCKRKREPRVDEVEDGQRAVIIEEGISTLVFNSAASTNYFEGLKALDYSLLKDVRRLAAGFEVARQPLWLWEKAILQGYDVFRELRRYREGWVDVDLLARRISYAPAAARPVDWLGRGT